MSTQAVELLGVVNRVRNRYRIRRALLGAAIAVGGSWAVLAISAYLVNAAKYSDNAILMARVGSGAVILGLVSFVVHPFLPTLGDEKSRCIWKSIATPQHHGDHRGGSRRTRRACRARRCCSTGSRIGVDRVPRGDGAAIDAGGLDEWRHLRHRGRARLTFLTTGATPGRPVDRRTVERAGGARGPVQHPGRAGNAISQGRDELTKRGWAASSRTSRAAGAERRLGELDASRCCPTAPDGTASACSTSARRRNTWSKRTACARRRLRSTCRICRT